jgi:outer membrane receptor for ferrienterochelin and colicins
MFRKSVLFCAVSVAAISAYAQAETAADTQLAMASNETVTITAQRNFRAGALKDDIVKTEVLSADMIARTGAMNINQALDNNPGIAVQVECSICNVRNVTLNNLPGRFTTLMIDGVPLFSSLSSAYGLDSVNARGIADIEVSRGAGASLIAPEALAGVVNIVTRKPDGFELEGDVSAGEQNLYTATAYVGDKIDDHWAASVTLSYNKQHGTDRDGNKVSEFTGFTRMMGGIALFGDFGNTTSKLRLDYIDEKRGGGALGTDYEAIRSSDSGNPFDWSQGPHGSPSKDGWYAPDGSGFIPYDSGRGGMSEIIFTKRASAIGTIEGKLADNLDWHFAYGYARNNQHSFYELTRYNANGNQAYSEASLRYHLGKAVFTLGGNYRYEDLASVSQTPDGTHVHGLDNYVYRTPGAFLEGYDTFFDDQLEVNASIRYDDNSTFGSIISPRANFLWHHTPNLSSRLSVGRGYRAPTSFFEQDHGILDTTKIVRQIDNPETSDNLSYALNYSDDRLSATASYNFNQIKNFALLDPSAVDGSGNAITLFTQAEHPVTVQGLDFTATYQLLPSLSVTAGGERFFYAFEPGTLAFSRPDWKLYLSADWDWQGFDVYGRLAVTGPQDLARFYDYANNPRYNFDDTAKMNESPVFATVDAKVSYALTENFSLYIGVNDLFDYNQADKESPLWIDRAGSLDVTQIWGPLQGRVVYGGVKVSL